MDTFETIYGCVWNNTYEQVVNVKIDWIAVQKGLAFVGTLKHILDPMYLYILVVSLWAVCSWYVAWFSDTWFQELVFKWIGRSKHGVFCRRKSTITVVHRGWSTQPKDKLKLWFWRMWGIRCTWLSLSVAIFGLSFVCLKCKGFTDWSKFL